MCSLQVSFEVLQVCSLFHLICGWKLCKVVVDVAIGMTGLRWCVNTQVGQQKQHWALAWGLAWVLQEA